MSQFDKLLERLARKPKDFTFDELRSVMKGLGYAEDTKGKTSGSRVAFVNPNTKHIFRLHKPHPANTLKAYVVEQVVGELKAQGVLK